MSQNLFKDHSIAEVEACLSEALTKLLARATTVSIAGMDLSNNPPISTSQVATFTVEARHEGDWSPDPFV